MHDLFDIGLSITRAASIDGNRAKSAIVSRSAGDCSAAKGAV